MATTINKGLAKKKFKNLSVSSASSVASALLLFSPYAHAADWTILPTLDLKETYTDNVRLTGPGTEKSDFVTQIIPGIALTGTGSGLKFKSNYSMQNLTYANGNSGNTTLNQLNADANAELLKDLFFLDGKATVSQQNISPFGPQAVNNVNITDNRTEVRTYSISPYFRQRFGSTATSELRFTHDSVDSNVVGLLTNKTDQINFKVDSGTAYRILGWGLQYNTQKQHYSDSDTIAMTTTTVNLRYRVTERFAWTASTGYEKSDYISIAEKPQGYFWSAGFSWTPSERTSLIANTGHRYFGNTFSLSANHRARYSIWSLGYNEDVTSTQSQFLIPIGVNTADFLSQLWAASVPDPVLRQQLVDTYMRVTGAPTTLTQNFNTLTNQMFLQKNLQASVAFDSAKTTLLLSAYNTLRDALSAQQLDNALLGTSNSILSGNTRQSGTNAIWTWRISPRTNAIVSAGYSRITALPIGTKSNNKTASVSLSKQFQPKLRGTIELRRLQQKSDLASGNVHENAITASVQMGF